MIEVGREGTSGGGAERTHTGGRGCVALVTLRVMRLAATV
jgi:hypothetical protein